MISKKDINRVARAMQDAKVSGHLALCVVILDTTDGTTVVAAPQEVNKAEILRYALEKYSDPTSSPIVKTIFPRD